jgi:hypothetical protein
MTMRYLARISTGAQSYFMTRAAALAWAQADPLSRWLKIYKVDNKFPLVSYHVTMLNEWEQRPLPDPPEYAENPPSKLARREILRSLRRPGPDYLTIAEYSKLHGLTRTTAYDWIRVGAIDWIEFNAKKYIHRAAMPRPATSPMARVAHKMRRQKR